MATPAEHRIADYTQALTDGGQDVTVGSESARMFVSPVEMAGDELERMIIHRKKLYHLQGAITTRKVGQVVTIDGVRWTVVGHWQLGVGPSTCLTVERVDG